jgi:hypothetical protein
MILSGQRVVFEAEAVPHPGQFKKSDPQLMPKTIKRGLLLDSSGAVPGEGHEQIGEESKTTV